MYVANLVSILKKSKLRVLLHIFLTFATQILVKSVNIIQRNQDDETNKNSDILIKLSTHVPW